MYAEPDAEPRAGREVIRPMGRKLPPQEPSAMAPVRQARKRDRLPRAGRMDGPAANAGAFGHRLCAADAAAGGKRAIAGPPQAGPSSTVRPASAARLDTGLHPQRPPLACTRAQARELPDAAGAPGPLARMFGAGRRRAGAALRLAAAALVAGFACTAAAAPPSPVTLELDRGVTTALESRGFSFAALMGAPRAATLDRLGHDSPLYADIARQVTEDVRALRAEMAADKRPLFEVTDDNVGRVMDVRWLASPLASFRLVGVVNRADRRDFTALTARPSCGEVRLIYRLAYRFTRGATVYASRLPVNVNAVFDLRPGADGACPDIAALWTPPAALKGADATAAWLAAGPLAPAVLRQVEINAQVVRLPSGMETELGGQAIYLMRVFVPEGGRAVPYPLENTPDVARLKADAALKARLVDYVRTNLGAIDTGVFQLPEEMLARKALSFSTFGSARTANHPFAALFTPEDFAGLPFDQLGFIASPAGLIARLDDATCTGCHQGAATAGFHLIGRDEPDVSPFNVVKVPLSPHLHAEEARRRAYLAALARGAAPDTFRPLSYAPPAPWTGSAPHGPSPAAPTAACILPPVKGAAPFREGWTCGAGTACQVLARNPRLPVPTGQCMPVSDAGLVSGMACLSGEILPGRAPWLDRFGAARRINSAAPQASPAAYTCRPAKLGVPGGSAYRQCTAAERAFAGFDGGRVRPEVCAVVGGKAFDLCVATDNFARCMDASVARGNRPTCGAGRFCREDFMCQALPASLPGVAAAAQENGFCSPTYFVFQMRIDGHPDPLRGVP